MEYKQISPLWSCCLQTFLRIQSCNQRSKSLTNDSSSSTKTIVRCDEVEHNDLGETQRVQSSILYQESFVSQHMLANSIILLWFYPICPLSQKPHFGSAVFQQHLNSSSWCDSFHHLRTVLQLTKLYFWKPGNECSLVIWNMRKVYTTFFRRTHCVIGYQQCRCGSIWSKAGYQ